MNRTPPPEAVAGLLDGFKDPMLPHEVYGLFRVDPKTLATWAAKGKIKSFRTLGGQRRYHKADVLAALNGGAR